MWQYFNHTFDLFKEAGFDLNNYHNMNNYGDTIICDIFDNKDLPGGFNITSDIIKNITFMYEWFTLENWFGNPK